MIMKKNLICIGIIFIVSVLHTSSQTVLMPLEPFNTNVLVHGSNAPTTVWFAPNSKPPIAWSGSGGCPVGQIGYESSWNSWWGNFVRLPQIDCSGFDTIVLSFDVTHSFFSTQTNDWCRFYMWADNGYKHNIVKILIDSVDVTHDTGINGKGFQFTELRSCSHVQVIFDISGIVNKTDILLYIEPSCNFNSSYIFRFFIDNVMVTGIGGSMVEVMEEQSQYSFSVYPNPVEDELCLVSSQDMQNLVCKLFSIQGELLLEHTISGVGHTYKLNISHLTAGFYLFSLSNIHSTIYKKQILKL
jgi:hypothetical protein